MLADVTRTSSKAGPRGSLALSICLLLVPPSHHNHPIGLSVCLMFILCLTHYSCLCMRGVSVCFTLYKSNEPASFFFALPFHLISINITEHLSRAFFLHYTAGAVLMRASICSPLFSLHHYYMLHFQLQTRGYEGLRGASLFVTVLFTSGNLFFILFFLSQTLICK